MFSKTLWGTVPKDIFHSFLSNESIQGPLNGKRPGDGYKSLDPNGHVQEPPNQTLSSHQKEPGSKMSPEQH